ncbi:YkvA family protein [Clostridium thermarum]|uniref:YkvA family protein n=1 Tax=Clostridium thermarum TaxID=1716543 RepID=UPI001123B331|nr:YkvA family protein [Clostridium thermarum]
MSKIKIKVKQLITRSKKELAALYIAYKRKDVPWYAKVFSIMVIGYALSPIDFIPDFIPVLGYLDDLILIPLGIYIAVSLIPKDILGQCRQEAENASQGEGKQNWVAAAVILIIWLIIIALILMRFL